MLRSEVISSWSPFLIPLPNLTLAAWGTSSYSPTLFLSPVATLTILSYNRWFMSVSPNRLSTPLRQEPSYTPTWQEGRNEPPSLLSFCPQEGSSQLRMVWAQNSLEARRQPLWISIPFFFSFHISDYNLGPCVAIVTNSLRTQTFGSWTCSLWQLGSEDF